MPLLRSIPRTVLMLGLVSFFTDASSEMIYPLLPIFLVQVLGAGAFSVGLIEGVAESTSALLKAVSGVWADRLGRRKPLVVAGYGVASVSRPLIGLASAWPAVLFLRFLDRVGKGIRSPARDAMIADSAQADARGTAFGFHQAMDHAGSVLGPLAASALMLWAGLQMRTVFLLAAIPAALAMAVLIWGVRESEPQTSAQKEHTLKGLGQILQGRTGLLFAALFLFTLGNSTDAFLLIRLTGSGLDQKYIPAIWALFHVVKMLSNLVGGRLSDRIGARPMITIGWALYAAVYFGFAGWSGLGPTLALFLIYGIHFGFTEPSEKSLVAQYAPAHLRGTVFGLYNFVVGFGALPASLLFGWVWQSYGATHAFVMGAALALAASLLLTGLAEARHEKK